MKKLLMHLILMLGVALVHSAASDAPYVLVLGVAQDGGVPQAGDRNPEGRLDGSRRRQVVCLALIDPLRKQRWLFEATPDFREQLYRLDTDFSVEAKPGLDGIFLTHAHMGHYTGLMFLGHESMGAKNVPVYAMPRFTKYLEGNGPWDQLVRYKNIALKPLADGTTVKLNDRLSITPFLVPHRQEYSEVVGYRVQGPKQAFLFIPDIDSWKEFDEAGTRIESLIQQVGAAYLDATFFANGEIPGRDMSGFPHPFITHSMQRFAPLPAAERAKVRFIHFNHTNPVLDPNSRAYKEVIEKGFQVAQEGEKFTL